MPVGIEKPTGLPAAAGQPVVALNPVVVARHRSRNPPTRRKSDRPDAALIANILRTDGQHHQPIHRNSPDALALRELTRAHLDAVSAVKHFRNQLRSLLVDYFPAAVAARQRRAGGLTRPDARAVFTPHQHPREPRGSRRAAGADTGWLDEMIRDLEPAAEQIHDLEVFRAIRSVTARRGPGPYPADELATMANQKLSDVRRVLDRMTAEGLATPPDASGQ